MNTLAKLYGMISLVAILATSCGITEEQRAISKNYDLEYSIESNVENISKIIYTDESGNSSVIENTTGEWNINTKAQSGQTVKLEVFGTYSDADDSNISMQINAKNGEFYTTREIDKKKETNKHFHYYLVHVLD